MTIKLQQPPAEKLTISQNTQLKYLRINYLGSDVQSIINLTSSLVKQSLSVRTYKIECPIIFAEKKIEELLHYIIPQFLAAKKMAVFLLTIYLKFNISIALFKWALRKFFFLIMQFLLLL